MRVQVTFWSYFRDHTGCSDIQMELPSDSTVGMLHEEVFRRFPALAGFRQSTLTAVGVEYQRPDHPLREGDSVALFPPVQGG